jgi:glutamate synthase (ferredoxin)
MGFTAEDLDLVIEDMAGLGKEPTYCMGDDIPLAVLSDKPHLLYDYFKQRFAQVTNPPIDPLREKLVMSLEMHLGQRRPAVKPQAEAAALIHLDTPVLNEAELSALSDQGASGAIPLHPGCLLKLVRVGCSRPLMPSA